MKRFERSNGPDTALYKNYLYLFFTKKAEVEDEDWKTVAQDSVGRLCKR